MNQRELKLVTNESQTVSFEVLQSNSYTPSKKPYEEIAHSSKSGDVLLQFGANLAHLEDLQAQFRFMTNELKDIIKG